MFDNAKKFLQGTWSRIQKTISIVTRKGLVDETFDQLAHVAAAIAILSPALFLGGIVWTGVSAAGIGIVRELTEGGGIFDPRSVVDIAFWFIGGAIVGIWN